MVGTSRDKDLSQEKQNHGWNFKRQGYITENTESWLELQETGIYHSRNRIMVGTSKTGVSQNKQDGYHMYTIRQNHGWNFKRRCITAETESWLELQETDVSQKKQNHGCNYKNRDVSQ